MDNINVQVNDQVVNQSPQERLRKLLTGPKIVFVILGIVLLGEIIYAVRALTQPPTTPFLPVAKTGVQLTPGTISLVALKNSFNVNESIPVSVMVDTGGRSINGVDLIVHYDPKVLVATSGGILKGLTFDEYPSVSIDPTKGLISISGIDNLNNSFNSNNISNMGPFAVLNFRAKTPGRTSLTIDFNGKGSTTDSNLVEVTTAKDILEKVNNLELTVK